MSQKTSEGWCNWSGQRHDGGLDSSITARVTGWAKSSDLTPWGVGRPWSSSNSWLHHQLTSLGLQTGLFSWTVRCLGQSVSKVECHDPADLLPVTLPSHLNSVPWPHGAISYLVFWRFSNCWSIPATPAFFLFSGSQTCPCLSAFSLVVPSAYEALSPDNHMLVILNLISAQMSSQRGHF